MILKRKIARCIVDINTQEDIFLENNFHYVRDYSRIISRIRRIMAWARLNDCLVISILRVDSHNNFSFTTSKKIGYTILKDRFVFPVTVNTDIPMDVFSHKQIVLCSRSDDPFDEPLIDRLLSEIWAKEFIIIGAMLEKSVSSTVYGLLQRNRQVKLISDAVGGHNYLEMRLSLSKMLYKGAKIIKARNIVGVSHLKKARVYNSSSYEIKTNSSVH
jgi:nicotinamidase-related amidase